VPRAWFELALEEANVQNFRWHDLRPTFISRLVMKDVNLRTVLELAGHKTISQLPNDERAVADGHRADRATEWDGEKRSVPCSTRSLVNDV